MASNSELIALTAREAVRLLRAGDVSPVDLVDAAAERIATVDPDVNALPTMCLDAAREQAKSLTFARQDEQVAATPGGSVNDKALNGHHDRGPLGCARPCRSVM